MGKTLSEDCQCNILHRKVQLLYNFETKGSFLKAKMHGISLAVKCHLELAISKSFQPIQKFGVSKTL